MAWYAAEVGHRRTASVKEAKAWLESACLRRRMPSSLHLWQAVLLIAINQRYVANAVEQDAPVSLRCIILTIRPPGCA